MDETQKITIMVETADGHQLMRTYKLDDDGIIAKDWADEITDMTDSLAKSLSEL